MNLVFLITTLILVLIIVGLLFLLFRASKKLLEFDDLFQLLEHDIETNVKYFDNLLQTPLYDNSQEVKAANHNMSIMRKRLTEFSLRIGEKTSKEPKLPLPAPDEF